MKLQRMLGVKAGQSDRARVNFSRVMDGSYVSGKGRIGSFR